jgi:hypothetical protein
LVFEMRHERERERDEEVAALLLILTHEQSKQNIICFKIQPTQQSPKANFRFLICFAQPQNPKEEQQQQYYRWKQGSNQIQSYCSLNTKPPKMSQNEQQQTTQKLLSIVNSPRPVSSLVFSICLLTLSTKRQQEKKARKMKTLSLHFLPIPFSSSKKSIILRR